MLLPWENPASWKCFQIFSVQRVPTIYRKGCTKINRIPQTGATCVCLSQCFLHPLHSRWDPTSLNSPGRKEILKIVCYFKEILQGNQERKGFGLMDMFKNGWEKAKLQHPSAGIIYTGFVWQHKHSLKLHSTAGVRSIRPVGSTHHREEVVYISDKLCPYKYIMSTYKCIYKALLSIF